jgi:hypothetical protein
MKLILNTTEYGLLYRRDDQPLVTMYGSAANCGEQFDDERNTRVRAFGTSYPGIHCISINQDGVGHRHFYVPVGKPLTLDGTEVSPRGYERIFSAPDRSKQMYQHRLYFQTAAQVKLAVCALLRTNIVAMNVKGSLRRQSLSFHTPYALGPVMRGTLHHEMQPLTALFNRQPQTWKRVPFTRRVTLGQVILTMLVFLFCCGCQFLGPPHFDSFISSFDFWDKVVTGLFVTIFVAWISSDILGLMQCQRRECLRQGKGDKA